MKHVSRVRSFPQRLPLLTWTIHRSSPTGRPPPCSAQTLWLVSPLTPACCLQVKTVRSSSPDKTQTSPACRASSPAPATAGHCPATGTARVSASTDSHLPPRGRSLIISLFFFPKSGRCSPHLASSATSSCWTGRPATP